MEKFTTILMFVAACSILYVLRWLVIKLSVYLKGKIDNAKESPSVKDNAILSEAFNLASLAIEKTAAAAVGKLENMIGKDLREEVKNGIADKSDLYALGAEAYTEIVDCVKPEILAELGKSVGNVELYIKNVIEVELLKLKNTLYGAKPGA